MSEGQLNLQSNNSQAGFWSWFQQNEARIWNIDKDREKIAHLVLDAIHQVDPGLSFEIGKVDETGKREFIISAGGISSNILKVENLYLAAPVMPRWRVIKYRQRMKTLPKHFILFGKRIPAEDIRFQVFNDGNKIGIILLFENYSDELQNQFIKIGFRILDAALGENEVMQKVSFIDFAGRESNLFADARSLPELPKVFDDYFKPH